MFDNPDSGRSTGPILVVSHVGKVDSGRSARVAMSSDRLSSTSSPSGWSAALADEIADMEPAPGSGRRTGRRGARSGARRCHQPWKVTRVGQR